MKVFARKRRLSGARVGAPPLVSLVFSGFFAAPNLRASEPAQSPREVAVDLRAFRVVPTESGPVNYYTLAQGPDSYWHAAYRPPPRTTVLGYAIPDEDRRSVVRLKWKWRAVVLPKGGDECVEGKGDSAAVVYVTFRRALRWYSLKYVWSAVAKRGTTCDRKRNPFRAQDTIVVDSGPPLNQWRTVEIDPDDEFRKHFENGDSSASVPDRIGIAIMTDGDQTASPSEADYGAFTLVLR
jgi:hypothetical protein